MTIEAQRPFPTTQLSEFDTVVDGTADCHVWRSATHKGILVKAVFVSPGREFDADSYADTLAWASRYEPYYDGLLSAEEAQQRGDAQRAAGIRDESWEE